jgi:methyl-accepting chemotaxis protein
MDMSRFTLSWRFSIGVGSALMTGIVVTAMLAIQLRYTSASYDALLAQREVQHQDRARVMQVRFKTQVQEWKNLLLRGHKPEDFKKYHQSFKEEEAKVRELGVALDAEISDGDARTLLGAFLAAHAQMGTSYGKAIDAFAAGDGQDFAAADAMVKGQDRAPTEQIDRLVARLQQVVRDRQRMESSAAAAAIRRSVSIALVAFGLVIAGVVYLVRSMSRELVLLTQKLTDAAKGTASGASEIASSAQALSQCASEQAAALEETSASMEEMASMTRRNAENSQSAARLMNDVDGCVEESNDALAQMVAAMSGIRDSSQQVARIIKTIDEIAFQTNILALNAAVEAARAGQAGMGFAVVADEVRNLAQRSATAARETAGLIETSISRAHDGAGRVDDVARSIQAITDSVVRLKNLIDQVSAASHQQAQGIEQVSQAVAQMEKTTQTNAATAEEGAAASEALSAQAEDAMAAVRRLEAIVGVVHRAQVVERVRRHDRVGARVLPLKEPRSRNGGPPETVHLIQAEEVLPLLATGTDDRF